MGFWNFSHEYVQRTGGKRGQVNPWNFKEFIMAEAQRIRREIMRTVSEEEGRSQIRKYYLNHGKEFKHYTKVTGNFQVRESKVP